MRRAIVLSIGLLLLSGCAEDIRTVVDDLFGAKQVKPAVAAVEPRYCYRTIGKVNCYTQPLGGEEANRLIGYEGAAPRATSSTGPLRP
ncbi:MAG: hypothetical protein O3B74_01195 [Proteobacteria bacterium]|nr:hypothetical protein [Pseudomonadota bacterium]MDA1308670.1 hypothetical protein [Pseudomonadota bacterium]